MATFLAVLAVIGSAFSVAWTILTKVFAFEESVASWFGTHQTIRDLLLGVVLCLFVEHFLL